MKSIKYNRTSTINQKGKRFQLDKNSYDLTLFDQGVSGKIPFIKRPKGYELMELVKSGEVGLVTFEDLSRVGRTLKDTIGVLDDIVNKYGVRVHINNLNLDSHSDDGSANPIWKLMIGVMGSIYEMERDRILEITDAGKKAYVLNGGKLGRPEGSINKGDYLQKPQNKQILSLLRKGKTTLDITARLNCSPKTVVRVRKAATEKGLLESA